MTGGKSDSYLGYFLWIIINLRTLNSSLHI